MKRPALCLALAWALGTILAGASSAWTPGSAAQLAVPGVLSARERLHPGLLTLRLHWERHVPAEGPLDLTAYELRIRQARLALQRLLLERNAEPARLAPVERSLLSLALVRLPDGRLLVTDTPRLGIDLRHQALPALRHVLEQLGALDDQLATRSVRAADARQLAVLDDVLRDRRFNTGKSIWEALRDWLLDKFGGLLAAVYGTGGVGVVVASMLGAFSLALVAAIGYLAARGALERMVVDVAPSGADEPAGTEAANRHAADRAAAGDYRTALRYLFLSTMLALQEHGVLELRPGLTNREYLELFRQRIAADRLVGAASPDALQELIEAFDRAWYGHLPVGPRDYARYQALAEQVLGSVHEQHAA